MKTSTNKQLTGWNDTYVPRNLNVKVAEWLQENGFDNDVENVDADATFADFKSCICGTDHGLYVIDTEKMGRYCDSYYMDTFLRDAIYSAIKAL